MRTTSNGLKVEIILGLGPGVYWAVSVWGEGYTPANRLYKDYINGCFVKCNVFCFQFR
jgi:hypothetical protein